MRRRPWWPRCRKEKAETQSSLGEKETILGSKKATDKGHEVFTLFPFEEDMLT
jgi:hypothetical protein